MTTEKKTIYVVMRSKRYPKETFDIHTYSRQTSNLEVMKKYRDEIQGKYPNWLVAVLPREQAKEIERKFHQHRKDIERKKLERFERVSDELLIRKTYLESIYDR
jgi:hypothetical protein